MGQSQAIRPAAAGDEGDAFQLSLGGQRFPVWGHAVFNLIAAISLTLLGHPVLAAAAFVIATSVDALHQRALSRWQAAPPTGSETEQFGQLGALSALRVSAYMGPTLAATLLGGQAELAFFGVQCCLMVALGMGAGSFSRLLFWSFCGPVMAAIATVAVLKVPGLGMAAMLVELAALVVLLTVIGHVTKTAITTWHTAFTSLDVALQQSEKDRAAADAAREEAALANRAKSNFLATMSHEIRTPMNGVLGMAQLLQRDETNPVQKERLGILIDSGEYLLSILNDILDVSKIDAGRLDIVPAAENVRDFLSRLVDFWGARADEKGVSLGLHVDDGVPDCVLIDALRLRQVLFNLVGNALKFTDNGSVEVTAEASPNGEGAILLHLTVRDTGPGIAAEHLPYLFNRFSQADASEERRFGGTGLGLAIAKQLVELMGGRIWAESTLRKGSAFHVKLPLAVAVEAPAPRKRKAPVPVEAPDMEGLRVLAVDDNAVNLLVLDQLLTSFGHEVAKASSGREALEALDGGYFDLILMDIQMPEMTGIEVLQRLRTTQGPNQEAPVVALTADVTSGGRKRYLQLGFTEHSSKPIQLQELMETIGRAMTARPGRRTRAA